MVSPRKNNLSSNRGKIGLFIPIEKRVAKEFRKSAIENHREMIKDGQPNERLARHLKYIREQHRTILGNKTEKK